MAPVNERRIRSQQLNGSDLKIVAFAHGFARVAVRLLGNVICFHTAQQARAISGVARSHDSGGLLIGDTSRLAQTELPGSVDQFIASEPLAQARKIIVAGIGNRLCRSERRQMICMHTRK